MNREKVYDVAIIGSGVSGATIARRLSKYNLKIAVLEKYTDISFGVSKANSGIVHAGFHHKPDTLKAKLEVKGNQMFDKLNEELSFPFKRVGIIVVAFSYEEMKVVEKLYNQGIENGVQGLKICSRDRILKMEPKLNTDVVGGLYAPSGGIIEPYRFVFTLMESAIKNGIHLYTDFSVESVIKKNDHYSIISSYNEKVNAKYVINAAGLYADNISKIFGAEDYNIIPRKGEEYLLEKDAKGFPNSVIFPVPTANSKGVLVIPTVERTMMIGPTAEDIDDKEDFSTSNENLERVFSLAMKMIPVISKKEVITSFAGLRPTLAGNDFYIDISNKIKHFIQVAGIQSPGLTASPAIAEYVEGLLRKDKLILKEKKNYDPIIKKTDKLRDLTFDKVSKAIKKNKLFGNVICRCELVSEAEILEAIQKGHTTLDGIKFYTRSGMGRCQGGFCTYKILMILRRETGMHIHEITKRGAGSYIIKNKISPLEL